MIETVESLNKKPSTDGSVLPRPLQALERLAWNFWWSWSRDGATCFRDIDSVLWEEVGHNPRLLLARASEFRLAEMATDPGYLERINKLAQDFDRYLGAPVSSSYLPGASQITTQHPVAYFCAEYGVHNSLPLYSGGLGVLAGDHLKSASDLGLPLVAVGLLYHYGYFRQSLRKDSWQEEHYGETHPAELPIHLIRNGNGTTLQIAVAIRGREVLAQVWRADVGRVPLYLLDTNIPENVETD